MIDRQAYLDTYNQAVSELAELVDEREQIDERRDQIDQRLAEVRKGVIALAPLCGKTPWAEHPDWFPGAEAVARPKERRQRNRRGRSRHPAQMVSARKRHSKIGGSIQSQQTQSGICRKYRGRTNRRDIRGRWPRLMA